MIAYTYKEHKKFELVEKLKPELQGPRDAIVRVTVVALYDKPTPLIPHKFPLAICS